MKVEDKLQEAKLFIEAELEKILAPEDSSLTQAMRYAVLSGGKRFRPLLALASGECCGLNRNVILPYACALELIHNYSLVHDDLPALDNDDVRRGQPSCHKAYGEDMAVLVGDGLLTLAFEILAHAPCDEMNCPRKIQMILEIAQSAGVRGMVGGQHLDISLTGKSLTEGKLLELIDKKTGTLILASVKVGPILADTSPSMVQAIIDYGKNIGLAFQIRDDIIDLSASLQETRPRPNVAKFFGREAAQKMLEEYVYSGIEALDAVPIKSEELRFLAMKLLEI